MRTRIARIGALVLSCAVGCDAMSSGDGGGDDGAASGGDDGGDAGGMCMPNDGDGVTQCTVDTCAAGEYCEVDGNCYPGCVSALNCAGQYCDLRMPAPNLDKTFEIGVCRTPGAECGVGDDGASSAGPMDTSGAAPSCDEVQGNYAMHLDTDVPSACNDAFSGLTMCSVAQSGCELTWGCDADFGLNFPAGPLDGSTYHGAGSYMGVQFDCTIEWVYAGSYTLTFSCAANVGQPIVCTGWGV